MASSEHQTVPSTLHRLASTDPTKPAFIFRNASMERFVLTRQQLWDYSRKFAAVLRKMGVAKGQVVCNTLRNSPVRLISDFGISTSGAIAMNGQLCLADGSDFLYSLNKSQCTALLVDPDQSKGAYQILMQIVKSYDSETGEIDCPGVPSLKLMFKYSLGQGKGKHFFEFLDCQTDMLYEKTSPTDVCNYLCTSGSTNFFKLVAYNNLNLLKSAKVIAETLGATPSTKLMNNRLLGWLGGYPSSYLSSGCTRIMFDESDGRPNNVVECRWRMACYEKCDIGFVAMVAFIELNDIRNTFEIGSELNNFKFKTMLTGGGPVSEHHVKSALGNICENIIIVYACTECNLVASRTISGIVDYEEFNVGLPRPGFSVKIVDNKGNCVPAGKLGEIFIKPPLSALYYVNEPDMTSHNFRSDGWLRLGDIGKMNNEGHLYVVGRDKFSIIRGTLVFYPHPIESFIQKCPGIKEVVIIGVPDDRLHQELCAVVIKNSAISLSVEDVKTFCNGHLANRDLVAACPRYVIFVDAYPMTPSGKLDRMAIKKHACQQLGLRLH